MASEHSISTAPGVQGQPWRKLFAEQLSQRLPEPALDVIVYWSTPLPEPEPNVLPVCFETPLVGRQAYNRFDRAKPETIYYRIALWDPTSFVGEYRLPDRAGMQRLEMLLEQTGEVMQPMRNTLREGDLLYVLQVPGDRSLKGLDCFQAAIWDLHEIRRRTRRHVLVSVHPDCYEWQWARKRFASQAAAFDRLQQTVDSLGYEILPEGLRSADVFHQCAAIITQSSGTGFEALLAGIPVVALSRHSFVASICPNSLAALTEGFTIAGEVRNALFARLAYCQWSVPEIEGGTAADYWAPLVVRECARLSSQEPGSGVNRFPISSCDEGSDEESGPLAAVVPLGTAPDFPPAESIPKVIHQIWLGPKPIPQQFLEWSDTWRQHHPEWEYKLWREADIADLVPEMKMPELFELKGVNPGVSSDVLRYEIMRQCGGMYVDFDFQCLRPVGKLLLDGCLHYADVHVSEAGVAWIASPSGHPFWEVLLEKVAWESDGRIPTKPGDIVSTTGPRAFQKAVNYWCQGKTRRRFADPAAPDKEMGLLIIDAAVVTYHRDIFYPYYHKEHRAEQFSPERYPSAWAAHHWGGSWIG